MQILSNSTCIESMCLSVDTFSRDLWFISRFPLSNVSANKEATEPRVPSGEVEVITSKFLRRNYVLISCYGILVSQITMDMFRLS
jgi:hypothetical protein